MICAPPTEPGDFLLAADHYIGIGAGQQALAALPRATLLSCLLFFYAV
jgi:hypothetical protein